MQVGRTKDQGLYNKPSAAVHPGALAAGTLPQYNTIIVWGGGGKGMEMVQDHVTWRITLLVVLNCHNALAEYPQASPSHDVHQSDCDVGQAI